MQHVTNGLRRSIFDVAGTSGLHDSSKIASTGYPIYLFGNWIAGFGFSTNSNYRKYEIHPLASQSDLPLLACQLNKHRHNREHLLVLRSFCSQTVLCVVPETEAGLEAFWTYAGAVHNGLQYTLHSR